jgi:murein DD-endopeptidase MepM/ murein hydrolase activator NlpD
MADLSFLRITETKWRQPLAAGLLVAGVLGVAAWRLWPRAPAVVPPAPLVVAVPLPMPAPAAAAPTAAAPPPHTGAPTAVRVTLEGPLESALVAAVGHELGAQLTQVVVRELVWWVTVPNDLRRGDVLDVVFSARPDAEPLVDAVRLRSDKAGRTLAAYRFQPAGSAFAHFYTRDGEELELRLRDAPVEDYDQVTSRLRDGRKHKGIDFRTPQGTPVVAPFAATVARRDWNFHANGNCVELREDGGAHRSAYFLHLAELPTDLRVGTAIAKGQVVAKSGNTGHSFAPHLHYQLMSSSGALLDPFVTEPTYRRSLPDEEKARFAAEVQRLDALLPAETAASL